MVRKSILLDLLNRRDWAQLQPLVDRFQSWQFYPLFVHAVEHLNLDVLYESKIHGLGHIERTLCHGGMSAMDEHLSEADTSLLLDACSYHDIGRSRDGLDFEHGSVAARFIGLVTGRTGEDLLILKAAVEAHSRKEKEMQSVLDKYHPSDMARAKNIAQLLKDADGLDRVRICDLDENFCAEKVLSIGNPLPINCIFAIRRWSVCRWCPISCRKCSNIAIGKRSGCDPIQHQLSLGGNHHETVYQIPAGDGSLLRQPLRFRLRAGASELPPEPDG